MKIKTQELTGSALDWAVAKCEGHQWRSPWILEKEGYKAWASYEEAWGNPHPSYSTDWSQGGPIIEREGVNLNFMQFDSPQYWTAHIRHTDKVKFGALGPTPLVAAMRCYCSAKLGDEIDVPEELCQQQSS